MAKGCFDKSGEYAWKALTLCRVYSLSVNGVHSDNWGFLGFLWLLRLPEVVCVCTVVCDTVATMVTLPGACSHITCNFSECSLTIRHLYKDTLCVDEAILE